MSYLATTVTCFLIRRFEERAGQLYGMGLIGGFCHLYIGQEAIAVGMEAVKKPRWTRSSPAIATTATCWPPAWTPKAVMAELTGPRRRRALTARAASMHMFRRGGGVSSVGTESSARRFRSAPDWLSLTATARTKASVSPISATVRPTKVRSTKPSTWRSSGKLPVVYVIENNQYAMGTSIERASSETHPLQARASLSTFRASKWDGMDVVGRQERRTGSCRARPAPARAPSSWR